MNQRPIGRRRLWYKYINATLKQNRGGGKGPIALFSHPKAIMGICALNFLSLNVSLCLLLFSLFFSSAPSAAASAELISTTPRQDLDRCEFVKCGEGTCNTSTDSVLGFHCECKPGWKKLKIGHLSFPSCVVPNCTVNFQCGNDSAPPPPPPPASTNESSSDPCASAWCGDGTCVAHGDGFKCACNEGSTNLLNKTSLGCFKQCYFGEDCGGVKYGDFPNSPPSSASMNSSNSSAGVASCCSRKVGALPIVMLTAIFLKWV
ncbi:uncharacterized protein LOC131158907 [Malania oleifera]|uniref:uncharacterized protein LOC131158907 n=1 Tax=Malania oleifera TaxID=397392 RepID=UPI0025AE5A03|nr:uncharacterized protein LOC131158907 [Malania oleifera]